MTMTYEESQNLNAFLKTHSFHYGSDKEVALTILKNYQLNTDDLLSRGLIEYTGIKINGIDIIRWTPKGQKLWELGNWKSYENWESILPDLIAEKEQNQELKSLELKLNKQQIKINELELKYKPKSYVIDIIAIVLSVLSLLVSLLPLLKTKQ
jgi:hypothetical protein